LALLAALVPEAAAQKARDKDTVTLKDGKSEAGEIKSEDFSGVVVGSGKPIPWDTVQTIEYAGEPEFAEAEKAFAKSKHEDALAEFQTVLAKPKLRPVIKQQALYHVALLRQNLGQTDEAIASWRELLQEFPTGRFLRAAGENLLTAYLSKKDFAGAEAALQELSKNTVGVQAFQSEVTLLEGRLAETQDNFVKARLLYEQAEKSGARPAVAQESRLGKARCLAREKKQADAKAVFQQLAGEDAPNHVLAGAWNGLGDLATEEGKSQRSIERLIVAVYGYLRGVVQYAPLPGESTLEYERALAGAARCFKLMSELEEKPDVRKLYAERSRQRLEQLKTEYPNSIYLEGL